MSALHALARDLMRLSAALAPKARADWARAMQAEFEAINNSGPALEWALGCLVTATSWRLRTDGGYPLAFLVAIATSVWFDKHWQEYVQSGTDWNLHGWNNPMLIAGVALPVCVAAAIVQRRSANAVWLLAIATAIALSAWLHSQWLDLLHNPSTESMPAWAAAILVLSLALPGVIAAAITWRLRADTVYVTALIGLITVGHWLDIGLWDQLPQPGTTQFLTLAAASPYLNLALPCLLLCAFRPDRTLLTIFVTSLINGGLTRAIGSVVLPMLNDPFNVAGNHPAVPNFVIALFFSWSVFGAALAGGAAGWTLGMLGRRFRAA